MKNYIHLLIAVTFTFGSISNAVAFSGAGMETLRAGAEVGFPGVMNNLGMPEMKVMPVAEPGVVEAGRVQSRKGSGRRLDFSVEKRFWDEYEVRQGMDINLVVRPRNVFPGDLPEYEVTGTIFGEELDFGRPLTLKKDVFGSRHTLLIEGAGMDIQLERLSGWGRMDVNAVLSQGLKPETAIVLLGLVNFLPGMDFSGALTASKSGFGACSGGERLSYSFRDGGNDYFDIDGDGVNLHVWIRRVGIEDIEYDLTGSAFGEDFGFGTFVVRTDKMFLGPRGYRVRGLGVDLEVRYDTFAGRQKVEVSGYPGDSAELAIFLDSFIQYIFSR